MEDDELLERENKRKNYLDFSKCVICYFSIQWKKTGKGIEITSLYEPFEAIATFGVICSKFLAKYRHP